MKYRCCFKSPFGFVKIEGDFDKDTSIKLTEPPESDSDTVPDELNKCQIQLEEYFDGKRKSFSFKFSIDGTDFQKRVWTAIMNVPYGKTASYKEVAILAGKPEASRAVGTATKSNKLWILVPCHRVINSNGFIGGYGGNEQIKKALIKLEKRNS